MLPLVPGYLAFVTALTIDERASGTTAGARRVATQLSLLFMLGFGIVFATLGLVRTPVGPPIAWVPCPGFSAPAASCSPSGASR